MNLHVVLAALPAKVNLAVVRLGHALIAYATCATAWNRSRSTMAACLTVAMIVTAIREVLMGGLGHMWDVSSSVGPLSTSNTKEGPCGPSSVVRVATEV